VRRVEVFTGAGRRRAWSAEQKREIVAESYESGETVSAVARRHGLTPQQLFGWRREPQAGRGARDDKVEVSGARFARVIVQPALLGPDQAIAPNRDGWTGVIEIAIGAITVRVAHGTDTATLTTVLRAVKAAT
jgi:transposase